jgi:hypothetical protein
MRTKVFSSTKIARNASRIVGGGTTTSAASAAAATVKRIETHRARARTGQT